MRKLTLKPGTIFHATSPEEALVNLRAFYAAHEPDAQSDFNLLDSGSIEDHCDAICYWVNEGPLWTHIPAGYILGEHPKEPNAFGFYTWEAFGMGAPINY